MSDFDNAGIVRYFEDIKRAKTPLWAKRCRLWVDTREFHNSRPLREAQGSPQGRVTWAFSFGSVFFHAKENEQTQMAFPLKIFAILYNNCYELKNPAASCRESSTVRTFNLYFYIRLLTPQRAAGNALAVAVQLTCYYVFAM